MGLDQRIYCWECCRKNIDKVGDKMILINQLKLPVEHSKQQLENRIEALLHIGKDSSYSYHILRRSIDARKKPQLFYIYSVSVSVDGEEKLLKRAVNRKKGQEQITLFHPVNYQFPIRDSNPLKKGERIVVVGAGPAGLFCAYLLALAGKKPVLLERGECVEDRTDKVHKFWETGKLYPNCNVQFGEGGAGTFSDGKLNTLVKDKDGRNRAVLETFVRFGAKETILYDAKPHIGTDVLCKIVQSMREEIIGLGGEVHFNSQLTDLFVNSNNCVEGILVNGSERLNCDKVVLAIGHSARDTFELLYEKQIIMEQKPFAVGFRVEHPQKLINKSQYGTDSHPVLGAAPYKVTYNAQTGRGVYSFCMCPGGYVVNASSEEGYLAVNGMSYSGRDGANANSAIIVSVGPDDFSSKHPLAGIEFQRNLEKKAYQLANGKIPVQRYGDFKNRVMNADTERKTQDPCIAEESLQPACKGAFAWCDLTGILPRECNQAFVMGMEHYGSQIKGFSHDLAILSGVESRTSSPVRILRDNALQSNIKGVYPCGEGAGYAGGITSAAMDGMRVAEAILSID